MALNGEVAHIGDMIIENGQPDEAGAVEGTQVQVDVQSDEAGAVDVQSDEAGAVDVQPDEAEAVDVQSDEAGAVDVQQPDSGRQKLKNRIEGILFAMGNSVEAQVLSRALEISVQDVVELCEELSREYEQAGRGIRIQRLENSFQMSSAKEIYGDLIQIASLPKKAVLSDTLLETLSIIAYKQPVTKAEIDRIRGVASGHSVSKLISYSLVEEVGRLEAVGRPILFGTTEEFLRSFGVSSLEELPTLSSTQVEEFRVQAEAEADQLEVGI